MVACSRNCKSWCSVKDGKENSKAGKVACARCAKPWFGLNTMETSKSLGLGPKRSWTQKTNSGGGVSPETSNLENSSLQLFFRAMICAANYYCICFNYCVAERVWLCRPHLCYKMWGGPKGTVCPNIWPAQLPQWPFPSYPPWPVLPNSLDTLWN